MIKPEPHQIKESRKKTGMTQSQAAAMVGHALRTWQDWESGKRNMHPSLWDYWLIKIEQDRPRFFTQSERL